MSKSRPPEPMRFSSTTTAFLGAALLGLSRAPTQAFPILGPVKSSASIRRAPEKHAADPCRHRCLFSSPATAAEIEEGGPVTGETRGACLLIESVAISRGSVPLIANADLRVEPSQRWGVVGANGAGKSSLLGAITGAVRLDAGTATIGPKVKCGYLRQTAVSGSVRTVAEEAASEMSEINAAKRRMTELEARIADGDISDKTMNALEKATDEFANAGGWEQDKTVASVLAGLGFTPDDGSRLCSEFSGGWQMRIALARLLLSQPSLLLLDEPSNHLDSTARDWLANYLSEYEGSLVLVSHDVALLDRAVNNIAEVAGGTVLKYVGCSYNKYLSQREERARAAQVEYEKNVAEAARLQAFVDRFGATATKASQAQSRVKMIEKMRSEGKLTPPPTAIVGEKFRPELVLPDPPKSLGEDLITLKRATIGYEEGAPLLMDTSLTIKRGMKIILRGPNGAGKSTLMSALRGKLELLNGERIENEKLRLGTFTQDLAQELDVTARAVELVTAHAREGAFGDITISDQQARSVMGRLGLSGDKPLRLVGDLSGGEKARVALSMFALKASNVLMLDEPSNHLDVECIAALSNALSRWGGKDGAVVVVSHDRAFCETVGFTHVGTVVDGRLTLEERSLRRSDWDLYDLNGAAAAAGHHGEGAGDPGSSKDNIELTPEEKQELRQKQKRAFNAPKRVAKLEDAIEKAELRITELDEEMMEVGNDVGALMDLTKLKEAAQDKVLDMTNEWEELSLLVEEMEAC